MSSMIKIRPIAVEKSSPLSIRIYQTPWYILQTSSGATYSKHVVEVYFLPCTTLNRSRILRGITTECFHAAYSLVRGCHHSSLPKYDTEGCLWSPRAFSWEGTNTAHQYMMSTVAINWNIWVRLVLNCLKRSKQKNIELNNVGCNVDFVLTSYHSTGVLSYCEVMFVMSIVSYAPVRRVPCWY